MTGCERILSRLERGPATAAELYAETYTVVHSRIADLRRQGYEITCERVAGKTGARSYLYSLSGDEPRGGTTAHGHGPPLPASAARLTAAETASSPETSSGGVPLPTTPAPPLQLSMEAA